MSVRQQREEPAYAPSLWWALLLHWAVLQEATSDPKESADRPSGSKSWHLRPRPLLGLGAIFRRLSLTQTRQKTGKNRQTWLLAAADREDGASGC